MKKHIVGLGIARAVYIEGILLDIEKSKVLYHFTDSFSWGCESAESRQLALAILQNLFDGHVAINYYKEFYEKVISKISYNNFDLEIDVEKFNAGEGESSINITEYKLKEEKVISLGTSGKMTIDRI